MLSVFIISYLFSIANMKWDIGPS
uniref:Uncharacterized protein n=1 Tax=Anguilla anguilla TaxID=7936 RepID=A0A0E9TA43_ANGAN